MVDRAGEAALDLEVVAVPAMEFEMKVTEDAASLKFIGTPSEDNPWTLKRAR